MERLDVFARLLADAAGTPSSRPRIVAVDGRGGGGKTTLAGRLCRVMAPAAVVHTDDIAWMHSRFGWDDLMIKGVLGPLHAGREVHYQPPAWQPNGRTGHVDVATGTSTVIVEGVGASRRQLADLVDVVVWVQSDFDQARRLGVGRDVVDQGLDPVVALQYWREWEAEEVPFLVDDRPGNEPTRTLAAHG